MYMGNPVGVVGRAIVGWALALVALTGCSREPPSPAESTNQVAQAATSDAGAPVTPTACVVSLGALQLGDNDTIKASIAGKSLQLGASVTVTGNGFSAGNVTVGNKSAITGTLSYAGQLTQGASDTFGALVHTNRRKVLRFVRLSDECCPRLQPVARCAADEHLSGPSAIGLDSWRRQPNHQLPAGSQSPERRRDNAGLCVGCHQYPDKQRASVIIDRVTDVDREL
jgi:hypothetical protein